MGRVNKSVEIWINRKLLYKEMARWIYFRKGINIQSMDFGATNIIHCIVTGTVKVQKRMYGNSIRIDIE